ncbi:efflux RND transporter permease subunit [Emcibacter nanhaiensis]|uniref:Efflux RND transporter permease subunit n=1 Tax=Emcibacter nanhaiensis TaxID=1505037 RepID=A0A501PFR5_9PROT|nr:efflux RND transporter permease subunit [Emcibacter nanhaiensis]TPD58877.1 efflux RND transporter permease subunit [Emcibacter nanhaiensis]
MNKLGISGKLTRATIQSPITPLFLIAAFLLGLMALFSIPREEEPQISVPLVDIHVQANGIRASDAAELITKPLEEIVKSIDGVEHVYSQTVDDQVLVTARFLVGTSADNAILRVHEKIRANYDRIPVGVPEPLVTGRGINDVATVVLSLTPKAEAAGRWREADLYRLADEVQAELIKVENVGLTYVVGGSPETVRIEPDPERLALYGITLTELMTKIQGANRSFAAGLLRAQGQSRPAIAGNTLTGMPDIGLLLVTARNGKPVYVRDVADIIIGPAVSEHRVMTLRPQEDGSLSRIPAINLALSKRAGANAVIVAEEILKRVEILKSSLIPEEIEVDVTRNYGETADEKANELLFHLFLATMSIVVLIGFAIGWREAGVTLVVIPVTILLTLFAANLMGYTINRVSLFALIFSIGILVDDAIVMIENIARHWAMDDGRPRIQSAIEAVSEVGSPTVIATLTVIAALLPMLFISGLMGPYMAPIPVNASAAMLFSFFIAVVVAPWLLLKVSPERASGSGHHHEGAGKLGALYRKVAEPVIRSRKRALVFLVLVGVLTFASFILFATRSVTVKLLPFDNKSELQIVVDLAEGASLEDTERVLFRVADQIRTLPEVELMQTFAGTAAPFNFNGLVRHYYLRQSPELGELQIMLVGKGDRDRTSHDIALDIRARLKDLALPPGTSLKVVEVPPGPPVMATLLAEIYGPDAATRQKTVAEVEKIFAAVPYIVDIDDSIGLPRPRQHITIDQERLEFFGAEQQDVYDTIQGLIDGIPVGYSYRGEGRDPLEIVIGQPKSALVWTERMASTPVPLNVADGEKNYVELGEIVQVTTEQGSPVIFRHNGYFTDMVMAELSGDFEAPIYGMLDVQDLIDKHDWGNLTPPTIKYHGQPEDPMQSVLLWDGEWEITYVTFRDMGIAFAVALMGIYVLVVGQFGSFKLPLVILTPVPLTLIGIILGHWLFGAAFTATSMIGFIALAGIIVRNSILLVDFIRHGGGHGESMKEILLEAGAVRFKPILLTALAAMIGAVTILSDPIFQGLAISLLFGLVSSTLLTVLVIPAIYIVLRDDGGQTEASSP